MEKLLEDINIYELQESLLIESSFNNLTDYIGGKWEYDVINKLSISLTNRTDGLYIMLVSNSKKMYSSIV